MRQNRGVLLCVLGLLMYSLGYAKAANTPAISDVMQEIAARQKNLLVGYVVSGCTHGVSASKVAPAFACKGYMNTGEYVDQSSATVNYGVRGCTAPTCSCWLGIHREVTGDIGTYRRQSTTHYVVDCTSKSRPAAPLNGLLLGQATLTSGQITGFTSRARGPFYQAISSNTSRPAAGTAGSLLHVLDSERGLWLDTGTQWVSLPDKIYDAKTFGAKGDGQTD